MLKLFKSLRELFIAVLLGLLLVGGSALVSGKQAPPPQAAPVQQEIVIEGTPEFEKDVRDSLVLIEAKAPEQYKEIKRLVRGVKLTDEDLGQKINAVVKTDGVIYVSRESYLEYQKTRAEFLRFHMMPGTIIHETTHLIQYENGKTARSEEGEREAITAERELLQALGLSSKDIEQVASYERLKSRWWEGFK